LTISNKRPVSHSLTYLVGWLSLSPVYCI